MNGWNTWDIRCLNAVMKPQEQLEIRVGLYDIRNKYLQDEFCWADMARLGWHDSQGDRYFDLDLRFAGMTFTMEFAAEGDRFVCKLTPHGGPAHIRFYVEALVRWGAAGCVGGDRAAIHGETPLGKYEITALGDLDTETTPGAFHPGILLGCGGISYLRCNHDMDGEEMERFLLGKRRECEAELVRSGGFLGEAAEAIVKAVVWNTVYDPTHNRVCTPVSRRWCLANGSKFGSFVLFGWDTFFNSLLIGIQDLELAKTQLRSVLSELPARGLVPNCATERGITVDRSGPPVGSYCVLKLYRQHGDRALLEESFDQLLGWNRWWMQYRDGNGDGLLDPGTDPEPEVARLGYQNHNLQAAKYETGLDDSPMYDDIVFNKQTNTMELADVGINAIYALDCRALAEIARILGRGDEAEALQRKFERMARLINDELWDEQTGIYRNRGWDGRFSERLSPTSFYPLVAGIAPPDRARRMVREHLTDPTAFWGQYGIPSISAKDPAYPEQKYWRGRIWPPMSYLVLEGLKQYGMADLAFEEARRSLQLFLGEWLEKNHVHENYNAVTGGGDDSISDPYYTWGALLAYGALSEWIEATAWDGMRFGNLSAEDGWVERYAAGSKLYSVRTGRGLEVLRNGEPYLTATMPAIVHCKTGADGAVELNVRCRAAGSVTVHRAASARATVNGRDISGEKTGHGWLFRCEE